MKKNIKNIATAIIIAVIITTLDQLSKFYVLGLLKYGNINVFPFFDLTLVFNKGITFGMLNGGSFTETIIIAIITIAIVLALLTWLFKTNSKYISVCIGLIIGGAIGNVIDRFLHVGVVDFLDFYIGKYHYPAFNLADSSICIAVVLLLLENVFVKGVKK